MKECPKCGGEVFKVSFTTRDTLVFTASIDDDYSMDTIDVWKDYPGDCDWDEGEDIECIKCDNIVYSNGKWEV